MIQVLNTHLLQRVLAARTSSSSTVLLEPFQHDVHTVDDDAQWLNRLLLLLLPASAAEVLDNYLLQHGQSDVCNSVHPSIAANHCCWFCC
jgi:hypothetical protein